MVSLTLISISPADGARNVTPDSNIVLTFNQPIMAGSGNISILNSGYDYYSVDIHSSNIQISGNILTLDPPTDFQPGFTYQVSLHPGLIVGADQSTLENRLITFQAEPPPGPRNLNGTPARDWLLGSNSNDVIAGDGGDDGLLGFGGNDVLLGGTGNDSLDGGDGDDSLDGGFGDDILYDDDGINVLHGGDGHDRLTLRAGNGRSTAYGDDGLDYLETNGTNDTLAGGKDNDYLLANIGATSAMGTVALSGGAGDDKLIVDMAQYRGVHVVLEGGTGKNTYEFRGATPDAPHVIKDFQPGIDTVWLQHAALASPDSNPFGPAGYLKAVQQGSDTLIMQDEDGAAGAHSGWQPYILFQNVALATLGAADFLSMSPDGNTAGVRLQGTDGDDSLNGSIDGDRLYGAGGSDFLIGGGGADTLEGGAGYDFLRGGSDSDVLAGGAGADSLDGDGGDDILDGGDDNDWLRGGGDNDILYGGAGQDMLMGGGGTNVLNGGSGTDFAFLDLDYSNARVTLTNGQYRVEGLRDGTGVNLLQDVERIVFVGYRSTPTLATDIDGNAGQLYRLYLAAFNHTPDDAGYAYWLKRADQGVSMEEIAWQFTQSEEFSTVYGANTSNASFVRQLYHTVLHRAPDDAGYTYWLDALDQQHTTRSRLLRVFAESSEHVEATAGLIGLGIRFDAYYYPF